MRISDWSSDVCSSDLVLGSAAGLPGLSPAVPQAVRGTLPRPTLIPGSAAASSRAQVFAGERTELRLRSGAATRLKATSSARWQALQVTVSRRKTPPDYPHYAFIVAHLSGNDGVCPAAGSNRGHSADHSKRRLNR